MAKPLNERIATTIATDKTRIVDLQSLIAEVHDERARLAQYAKLKSAEAFDLNLSETDRDEAEQEARRAERNSAALLKALGKLEPKLKAKQAAEGRALRQVANEAALADRDALADRIREVYPRVLAELIDLFRAIKTNDEALKRNAPGEISSEAIARKIGGNFYHNGVTPITRLTDLKLPEMEGPSRAWPPITAQAHYHFDYAADAAKALASAETEEKAFGWYRISHQKGSAVPLTVRIPGTTRTTRINLDNGSTEREIKHSEAERLRREKVTVEAFDATPASRTAVRQSVPSGANF